MIRFLLPLVALAACTAPAETPNARPPGLTSDAAILARLGDVSERHPEVDLETALDEITPNRLLVLARARPDADVNELNGFLSEVLCIEASKGRPEKTLLRDYADGDIGLGLICAETLPYDEADARIGQLSRGEALAD
ncbi:hypothetical protein ACMA5I_13785 [Paracoccaceae bacterium GXU_MW_L88]